MWAGHESYLWLLFLLLHKLSNDALDLSFLVFLQLVHRSLVLEQATVVGLFTLLLLLAWLLCLHCWLSNTIIYYYQPAIYPYPLFSTFSRDLHILSSILGHSQLIGLYRSNIKLKIRAISTASLEGGFPCLQKRPMLVDSGGKIWQTILC